MHKQVKAVIFDVDGTLIEGNSWTKLNRALGITPKEDRQLFNDYHAGQFTYQGWVDRIVALYSRRGPVRRSAINAVLRSCALVPGAKETIQQLRRKKYRLGIISAGLEPVVYAVARRTRVSPTFAFFNSSFRYNHKTHLERIITRGEDYSVKLTDLDRLCSMWGLKPQQCVYVGDGPLDAVLFKATGLGITFADDRCSSLHGCCWQKINRIPDLLKIL